MLMLNLIIQPPLSIKLTMAGDEDDAIVVVEEEVSITVAPVPDKPQRQSTGSSWIVFWIVGVLVGMLAFIIVWLPS